MNTDDRRKHIELLIERCHKIELAAAESAPINRRKNTTQVIEESFKLIRANAPIAYIQLMKLSLNISNPSVAAMYGKLAGYAMVVVVENEKSFEKIMEINQRKLSPVSPII